MSNAKILQDETQLVKENGKFKMVKTVVQETELTTEMIYQSLLRLDKHEEQLLNELEKVRQDKAQYEQLLSDIKKQK